jgi:phage shock protein E
MKALVKTIMVLVTLVLLGSCVAATPAADKASNPAPVVVQAPVPASGKLPASLAYEDLTRLLADQSANVLLVDVRTQAEFDQGHIAGALLSPYDGLETMFKEQDKNRPIVLYCRSGNRSSIALRTLTAMGYTNVSDFGGINRWRGSLARP